jgi:hypothetical protein
VLFDDADDEDPDTAPAGLGLRSAVVRGLLHPLTGV